MSAQTDRAFGQAAVRLVPPAQSYDSSNPAHPDHPLFESHDKPKPAPPVERPALTPAAPRQFTFAEHLDAEVAEKLAEMTRDQT